MELGGAELGGRSCSRLMSSTVTMLDMNISQFLKSLGLDHLRDIFEREQVGAWLPWPPHPVAPV